MYSLDAKILVGRAVFDYGGFSYRNYTFYSNHRLSYVNLEWNRLATLPPQMFHPNIHQSMTQLRLGHNRIQTIQSESFLSFPAINLDLSYNQISTIEKDAFSTSAPPPPPTPTSRGASKASSSSSSSASSSSPPSSSKGNSGRANSNDVHTNTLGANRGPFLGNDHNISIGSGNGGGSPVLASASSSRKGAKGNEATIGDLPVSSVVAAAFGSDDHPGLNVYLNHNRLTTIRPGAFSQEKFNLIDLSYNFLTSFSMDVLGRRTIIEGLNVSHNSLERLNLRQRWAGNHIVKFLDLSYNRIRFQGVDFTGLCVTTLLDLSHNLIEKADAKIFPANCSLKVSVFLSLCTLCSQAYRKCSAVASFEFRLLRDNHYRL